MSSESSESDNFSSTEEIELKEYSRRSNSYSDSESSADFMVSGIRTIKDETEEGEVNEVATTSLNTSDEKHHEFDIERMSLGSLEGISPKDLNRTRQFFSDTQANVSTRKTLSLEGFSIRSGPSLDSLEGPPPRMASSLDPLKGSATNSPSFVDPLEGPSNKGSSSLDSLKKPATKSHLSMGSLEKPLPRMASPLDPLKKQSTRSLSYLDSLEGPPPRMASSLDPPKEPATKSHSSMDFFEGPPPRKAASLNPLKEPSSISLSSVDPLEGCLVKRAMSLDHLRTSTRRVSPLNPLEGPSTQIVWFPDSKKSSVTNICASDNPELETDEPSSSENSSDEIGFCCRMLFWLINFLIPYSRQIRHSKYYPLFYVALLAIPCSAGYMSSRYWELCYWCTKLPLLVYGLGMLGMGMIILQITAILSRRYFSPPLTGREFKYWMWVLALPFYFFLVPEMATIYLCDPDFTPSKSNEKFCIKVFYDYTYYLNIIVPLVNVLIMLIHLPGWYDPSEDD